MQLISKEKYSTVIGLLEEGIKYPEVLSVLEGNNPGDVFIDDIDSPKTGLVWNQGMKGFYFIGNPESPIFMTRITRFIENDLHNILKERNIDYFEVSGTTSDWEQAIQQLFKIKKLKSWKQIIYSWDEDVKYIKRIAKIPYEVLSLKEILLQPQTFMNWDQYKKVLIEFWGDIDSFKDKGNCYFAIDGNKIIGSCYSAFVTTKVKTIGIETDQKYQNQGVGYTLALHCVKEALDGKRLPWWDCMKSNIPSSRLAEKLGFVKDQEYLCFRVELD